MVYTAKNTNSRFKTDEKFRRMVLDSNNKYKKKRYHTDPAFREERKRLAKQWRNKQKLAIFTHYTKGTMKCQCTKCDVTGINFLTLEHKNGGGTQHRKRMAKTAIYKSIIDDNYPDEYTVLCWNCNCSRGQFGYCHT